MASGAQLIVVYILRYRPDDAAILESLTNSITETRYLPGVMHSVARRAAYFAGRGALALAFREIGAKMSVKPDPEYGFLRVEDSTRRFGQPLFVNISHTQDIAVAAVSTAGVGVDVESATRDPSKVFRRVATGPELEALPAFCDERKLPPICLWSAKEAFAKALGLGLKFGLRRFAVDLGGKAPIAGQTTLRGPLVLRDPAFEFRLFSGFLVALCAEREDLMRGVQWRFGESKDIEF